MATPPGLSNKRFRLWLASRTQSNLTRYVDDHYKLTAKVTDRNGTIIKTYEVNDKVTTWIGIWVIPFMGNSANKIVPKVWENMVKTVYQKMDQDKLMPYAQLPWQNRLLVVNLPY